MVKAIINFAITARSFCSINIISVLFARPGQRDYFEFHHNNPAPG